MKKRAWIFAVAALAAAAVAGLLLYNGVIHFNNPSIRKYPVRGVDVSAYQGTIHWDVLSRQDSLYFAYIKATAGSDLKDKSFETNWTHAKNTDLAVGAYHLMRFDSPGWAQADHFISVVPNEEGSLPPAVDVELYGEDRRNPPSKEAADGILKALLEKLEAHYGKKPVIYATQSAYKRYISGDYTAYPIWIRNVFTKPILSDKREWTFWQYSGRQVLKGYEGEQRFIDMNVFNGTKEEFDELFKR